MNRGLLGFMRQRTLATTAAGEVTLVAGAATVPTIAASSTALVFLQRKTLGGTAGTTTITRNAGISFTVTSDNGADTSTFAWLIVEPHA